MKPSWTLIVYKNRAPFLPIGSDNVVNLDAGDMKTNVIKIYIFDGPMRQDGFRTISANIEGSRYRDKGYLFCPERYFSEIKKNFAKVFDDCELVLKNGPDVEELAWTLFSEGMGNKSLQPIQREDLLGLSLYELEERKAKTMTSSNVFDAVANPTAFIIDYKSLSEELKQEIILGIQQIASEILPNEDKVRRLFGKMQKITDEIASGAELLKVLESILDGVLQTFGNKPLAASICGFDEGLPAFYQFDPATYIVKGPDKVQRKNMVYPPRLGKHIHPVDGKLWPGTAMQVMEYQRYKTPSQRPIYISDIRRWPDWMPPLRDPNDPKLASTAYIPLIVSEQRVGIIILQFSEHHSFRDDEKQELSLYAKTASSILYNAQLEKRLHRNINGIKRLEELTNKSSDSTDIQDVLKGAAKLISEIGFNGFVLFLLPDTEGKNSLTYFGSPNIDLTNEIPPSFSYLEFPIGYWEKSLESMFDRQITQTDWCLGYALDAQNRKLGLLLVLRSSETKLEASPFLDFEKDWVASLARRLAIIIDDINSKERLANKSVAISNVARIIADNPGILPLELLDSVSTELVKIFREKDFYIVFYNSNTDEVRYEKLYRQGKFSDRPTGSVWKKSERTGIIEYIINSKQTLFIPNNFEEDIQQKDIAVTPDQGLPLCFLGVPIKRKDKVYGVIVVQDFRVENTLRTSDKAVIEALSSLFGLQMD